MPVLLDTDHLSVLEWEEQPACQRLLERLDRLPPDDIATSIVNFQEQVQGSLAYLNRARKAEQIVVAYARLDPSIPCLVILVLAGGPAGEPTQGDAACCST